MTMNSPPPNVQSNLYLQNQFSENVGSNGGKLYNFRNFSVSQTSSKESMVGGGPVPTKVISANLLGGATPPQDFSIVNAPIFNS